MPSPQQFPASRRARRKPPRLPPPPGIPVQPGCWHPALTNMRSGFPRATRPATRADIPADARLCRRWQRATGKVSRGSPATCGLSNRTKTAFCRLTTRPSLYQGAARSRRSSGTQSQVKFGTKKPIGSSGTRANRRPPSANRAQGDRGPACHFDASDRGGTATK